MNKSIMIVELYELSNMALEKGYEVGYLSKGHEASRESLNYGDAEKFANYDAVILHASPKQAEELRQKMKLFKQKNTLICWCAWYDFWYEKGGQYQITTIDESFLDGEAIEAKEPNFDGFKALCNRLESTKEELVNKKSK